MTAAVPETRSEFHARRAKGIGGSDVGAILGLDRYRTPVQVWEEKVGITQPSDDMTPDQERGVAFESIALDRYARAAGSDIVRTQVQGAHPEYPWMLYTLDAMEISHGDELPIEVKCPSLGMWSRIRREGLPDSWVLQMQHYLCCSGYGRGRYVIFCADRMELMDFEITADAELAQLLIDKEREFWALVEDGTPPADIIAEIQDQKIVVVGEVTKRFDVEFDEIMRTLREAKNLVKTAETLEEDAKSRLLEAIEQKPGIYEVPGVGRVHYQTREGRTSFDAKALANARPLDRIAVAAQVVKFVEEYGEKAWAAQQAEVFLEDCDLDLSKFEKKGKPFTELRAYFGKGE